MPVVPINRNRPPRTERIGPPAAEPFTLMAMAQMDAEGKFPADDDETASSSPDTESTT